MAQQGLTRKQFRIHLGLVVFWELYAAGTVVLGLQEHSTLRWSLGAVLGILYLAYGIYLIVLRKRHPIDDPRLDKEMGDNFKAVVTGMGIFIAIITVGFLIAFGLIAVLK